MARHRISPLSGEKTALKIYEQLCDDRDQAAAERAAAGDDEVVPLERLRFTKGKNGKAAIDLRKADPRCERCHGTGRRPDRVMDTDSDGEKVTIPVICACVHRRGGIAKDMLDRMVEAARKRDRWDERRKRRRRAKNRARRQKRRVLH
jgi:hypothetical protein